MGEGRKQAMRRAARRARDAEKRATRARDKARYPGWYDRRARLPVTPLERAIQVVLTVVLVPVFVLGILVFLHDQLEIAQVMATGRSAQASVKAVSCSRGRSDLGDVTVTFTDFHGNMHRVAHTSDTFGCFDQYYVGDVITIRYAPTDPTMLLTQAEIDSLPWPLVGYVLFDVVFVISPLALFVMGCVLWSRQLLAALRSITAASSDASPDAADGSPGAI